MGGRTAVVVPYFQEERGILREAVLSAASQVEVRGLEIIVVDDGSPVPARDELDGLDLPDDTTLKLVEQANRGPGAARNRALDSVNPDTLYVAFLDSDDRWTNGHLRNAHHILDQGYDLYFSNAWFSGDEDDFFSRQGIQIDRHICLDRVRRLYRFIGDARFDLVCSRNIFHASTVVYRYDAYKEVRFPEMFFMGEDLTFWMKLLSYTQRVAFACTVECFSSRGVHIYDNSGWDTAKAIWRLHEYIKWRKWLGRTLLETRSEIHENKRQIMRLRRDFVVNLLHELRNGKAFRNTEILRFLRTDPLTLLYLGPVAIQQIIKRMGF